VSKNTDVTPQNLTFEGKCLRVGAANVIIPVAAGMWVAF